MSKVVLNAERIQQDTLDEFIVALENATGCHVELRSTFELEVDDPKCAAILQTVFGGSNEPVKAVKKPASEGKSGSKGPNAGRKIQPYTVLNGPTKGRELAGKRLSSLLKAHEIETGTILEHPNRGTKIVVTAPVTGELILSDYVGAEQPA